MNNKYFLKNLYKPYPVLNLIFGIIILLIFVYSATISTKLGNYLLTSNYTAITGKESISSGLSRSFSEIVRFDFKKAKEYNPFGLRVFMFFLVQFFLRILSLILIINLKNHLNQIIFYDVLISIILFGYIFLPVIQEMFSLISANKA